MIHPAAELRNVHVVLGRDATRVSVLKGISLIVQPGEVLAVVGRSGSGKSTLLMTIAGLERPEVGSVWILGERIDEMNEDALARLRGHKIGILFQSFHLLPTMTALENVAIPLELAGRDDAFDIARFHLDKVGLYNRRQHLPSELSGGEQQRVALARALAITPAVLLADEPTGNLDEETGEQAAELLFRLREENGTAMVLITHDPSLAARCDRILAMRAGELCERVQI